MLRDHVWEIYRTCQLGEYVNGPSHATLPAAAMENHVGICVSCTTPDIRDSETAHEIGFFIHPPLYNSSSVCFFHGSLNIGYMLSMFTCNQVQLAVEPELLRASVRLTPVTLDGG